MIPGLQSTGSIVVVHGLSYPMACGIFLDQISNPVSSALEGGFFTTEPSGKSLDETLSLDFSFFIFCLCSRTCGMLVPQPRRDQA